MIYPTIVFWVDIAREIINTKPGNPEGLPSVSVVVFVCQTGDGIGEVWLGRKTLIKSTFYKTKHQNNSNAISWHSPLKWPTRRSNQASTGTYQSVTSQLNLTLCAAEGDGSIIQGTSKFYSAFGRWAMYYSYHCFNLLTQGETLLPQTFSFGSAQYDSEL